MPITRTMTFARSIRRRLRVLIKSEQGIALPVAMLTTFIGLAFAGVVILASVNTQSGDNHDHASDTALAAADAGANLAVLRQNMLQKKVTSEKPCVVEEVGPPPAEARSLEVAAPTNGWCASRTLPAREGSRPTGEGKVGGNEYTYRIKPYFDPTTESHRVKIYATGSTAKGATATASGAASGGREATRRIMVEASSGLTVEEHEQKVKEGEEQIREEKEEAIELQEAEQEHIQEIIEQKEEEAEKASLKEELIPSIWNPFAYGQIVGIESLYLKGNSKVYKGGAGSNGKVEIIDSSKVCGGLRYGPNTLAPVGRPEQVKNVKPVSEQPYSNGTGGGVCFGEKPTQGTVEYPPVAAPSEIKTKNSNWRLAATDPVASSVYQRGNISWNASNRALSINYASLKLEGSDPYFLCSLVLTGGSILYVSTDHPVRIFFDEPKNCPGLNGGNQLTINGGTRVESDNHDGPGFYLLGSTSGAVSKVYFGNGAASANLVIYAPRSTVEIAGGINLNGAVLGKTMRIEGGANINPNASYIPPPAAEFTTTPPPTIVKTGGVDPKKQEERAKRQKEREENGEEREESVYYRELKFRQREETQKEREENEGTFHRGAYVECSSQASGGNPSSGC